MKSKFKNRNVKLPKLLKSKQRPKWKDYFTEGNVNSIGHPFGSTYPKVYNSAHEDPIKRYRYDKFLGEGTFGKVYSVEDNVTHKTYALKEVYLEEDLPKDLNNVAKVQSVLRKTMREFDYVKDLARKIGDECVPYLACVHDVMFVHTDEEDPRLYILMEKYDTDLDEWRRKHGEPSNEQLKRLMNQWTIALTILHDAGIVHRDIKPKNMLMKWNEEDKMWDTYLSDFGAICKLKDNANIHCDDQDTTYWFADPYMKYTKKANPSADWYAIGWSLYFAITGKYHVSDAEDEWIESVWETDEDDRYFLGSKGYLESKLYKKYHIMWEQHWNNTKLKSRSKVDQKIWEWGKRLTNPNVSQRL